MELIYPVTIYRARYGGTYEGGEWVAFNLAHVPYEAEGDDTECSTFFTTTTIPYGVGSTPDVALRRLAEKLGRTNYA